MPVGVANLLDDVIQLHSPLPLALSLQLFSVGLEVQLIHLLMVKRHNATKRRVGKKKKRKENTRQDETNVRTYIQQNDRKKEESTQTGQSGFATAV